MKKYKTIHKFDFPIITLFNFYWIRRNTKHNQILLYFSLLPNIKISIYKPTNTIWQFIFELNTFLVDYKLEIRDTSLFVSENEKPF